jgi:hypothetical protein
MLSIHLHVKNEQTTSVRNLINVANEFAEVKTRLGYISFIYKTK